MKHLEEVIINYDKKLMEANAEIERLQQRIDKAIEYIENQVNIEDIYPDYNEIIRILKGGE